MMVLGSLNTDIIVHGFDKHPGLGGLIIGEGAIISAGGKACNVARMAAQLLGKNRVGMVGHTARDSHGLYKLPLDSLTNAGVDISGINIEEQGMPSLALVAVNREGTNQIYLVPGTHKNINDADIQQTSGLTKETLVALSFEMPYESITQVYDLCATHGYRLVVDPGGIDERRSYDELLSGFIPQIIKPNVHETRILTGIDVVDEASASSAAEVLCSDVVLITAGANGAYLCRDGDVLHLRAPLMDFQVKDETGCGDQVMATLCSAIIKGQTIEDAARLAIYAGSLQHGRRGIVPLSTQEIDL